jgi:hypothetical protein
MPTIVRDQMTGAEIVQRPDGPHRVDLADGPVRREPRPALCDPGCGPLPEHGAGHEPRPVHGDPLPRRTTLFDVAGTYDSAQGWSPDGKLLAYTSGPDDTHGDIRIMTAGGRDLRGLTTYAAADESPDWQAIPAPRTDRRCGDAGRSGSGPYDVRLAGAGVTCRQARGLACRWVQAGRPRRVRGYAATATDFGGTRRVELRRGDGGRRTLVAFLYQRSAGR